MECILSMVAREFGVSVEDLKSKRRFAPVIRARSAAAYLYRKHYDWSYGYIASIFGRNHHQPTMQDIRRCHNFAKDDPDYKAKVKRLSELVEASR